MVKLRPHTRAIASNTSFFISFIKEELTLICKYLSMLMFVAIYLVCSYIFDVIYKGHCFDGSYITAEHDCARRQVQT